MAAEQQTRSLSGECQVPKSRKQKLEEEPRTRVLELNKLEYEIKSSQVLGDSKIWTVNLCMRACMHECVHACVCVLHGPCICACMRECVRACVWHACEYSYVHPYAHI